MLGRIFDRLENKADKWSQHYSLWR
jgi:hypothetical protein